MKRLKLIFECPRLPGGLIFTQVVDLCSVPAGHRARFIAAATGLHYKASEPTTEPVSPLRFAPERLDLGGLVTSVLDSRSARSLSLSELRSLAGLVQEMHENMSLRPATTNPRN